MRACGLCGTVFSLFLRCRNCFKRSTAGLKSSTMPGPGDVQSGTASTSGTCNPPARMRALKDAHGRTRRCEKWVQQAKESVSPCRASTLSLTPWFSWSEAALPRSPPPPSSFATETSSAATSRSSRNRQRSAEASTPPETPKNLAFIGQFCEQISSTRFAAGLSGTA